jgi:hypothetical protein
VGCSDEFKGELTPSCEVMMELRGLGPSNATKLYVKINIILKLEMKINIRNNRRLNFRTNYLQRLQIKKNVQFLLDVSGEERIFYGTPIPNSKLKNLLPVRTF